MTTRDTLVQAALERFARFGYLGTSIQQVAADVGTSKSSVLYHFDSKEALLEAAMAPALDALSRMIESLPELRDDKVEAAPALVAGFVDTLVEHSAAVSIFISQRGALQEVPVIQRGNQLVDAIAAVLVAEAPSTRALTRLSIGLAGVAFILGEALDDPLEHPDPAELRDVLVETLLELCMPACSGAAQHAVGA